MVASMGYSDVGVGVRARVRGARHCAEWEKNEQPCVPQAVADWVRSPGARSGRCWRPNC